MEASGLCCSPSCGSSFSSCVHQHDENGEGTDIACCSLQGTACDFVVDTIIIGASDYFDVDPARYSTYMYTLVLD
jgi:hypothetical protein